MELIEQGIFDGEKIENILQECLTPMIKKNIDFLVLGCTHYPILIKTIKSLLPKKIEIIEPLRARKKIASQTGKP